MSPIVSRREHGEKTVIVGGVRAFDWWRFCDVEEDLLLAGGSLDWEPLWRRRHSGSPATLERESGLRERENGKLRSGGEGGEVDKKRTSE